MASILVAEDDKFLANAYRVKLTGAGHEVTLASDGEETLKQLKKNKPDLLILDIIMPKIDGFSVLEQIKNDSTLKSIPVIIASNLGQAEDITKAKELGATDYIIKADLTLEDLVQHINRILK